MNKTIILMSMILLWSGQVFAACDPTQPANTPTSAFTDNGNGTVTHSKTGLTWKRCSEGQTWDGTTCTGSAAGYSWPGSLNRAATLNAGGGFAGFTDWRVPNIKELGSIIETQCSNPYINETIFPTMASNSFYNHWSSTQSFTNSAQALGINFLNGGVLGNAKTSPLLYILLVRGGQ